MQGTNLSARRTANLSARRTAIRLARRTAIHLAGTAAATMALSCGLGYAADWTSASPKRAAKPAAQQATIAPSTDTAPSRSGRLVPFPEDEAQAAAQRKSDFQPRFKPPAVRQANHTEPIEENVEGPKLLRVPDEAAQDDKQTESAANPATPSPATAAGEPT